MTAKDKIKTSYDFPPKVKDRLGRLKLDLRLRGCVGVSETAILEALIDSAKITDLERLFKADKTRARR